MEKVHWSTIEWPLATYVILIQLPCERCCSSSSLSFSPQISTGGSSGAFQIRTVAAEHPRAVWIQFSLEHQFILSNLWIQFSVSGSFLEAHPGSWLDYAAAGEYFNLNKLQFHSFRQKFELVSLQSFWRAGQKRHLHSGSPSMEKDWKWSRIRCPEVVWMFQWQLWGPEMRSYFSGHLGLVKTPLGDPGIVKLLPQSNAQSDKSQSNQ